MFTFEFVVHQSHPSLMGHFPGNPVVPGVVILDKVISELHSIDSKLVITSIPSVKFIMPLEPDVSVSVNVTEKKPGLLSFVCKIEESVIATGQLRVQQADKL